MLKENVEMSDIELEMERDRVAEMIEPELIVTPSLFHVNDM